MARLHAYAASCGQDKVVTVSKTVHGLMLWRSTTVVPVAADILYKFVCDLNTMARFDPSLSLCKEMRRLDDQHFLNYYQVGWLGCLQEVCWVGWVRLSRWRLE